MTLPSLAAGALFSAHWIVGRVLGKHELSVVYEAEDAHKARFAALKLFETALARDTAAWQRFETLTRSLAALPGEGIARSYDVGVFEGRPFVASECTVFPTLSRYLSERGPIPPRAFRDTLMTLASALEAAHRAGIVHGNLKPQNVFVSIDTPGWARLTDFGVAELREAAHVNQPRTLGWNAPEVSPAPPTPASDLFALGLIAFFSLSGSPWYSAQRTSLAGNAERSRTASERARAYGGDLPAGLDAWFEQALAREPRDRFASADYMAQAFVRAVEASRSSPPSFVAPLAATIPVPEKSPFARSNVPPREPPASKLDPHGPTAPQVAVTEPLPARQAAPELASAMAPRPVTANSSPPQRAKAPATVSFLFFGLGAFVISALVLGLLTWFLWPIR